MKYLQSHNSKEIKREQIKWKKLEYNREDHGNLVDKLYKFPIDLTPVIKMKVLSN
jgi:hypothetical protein